MSRTMAYSGMLPFITVQFVPPSMLTNKPISVPKNNRFLFCRSSFILCAKLLKSGLLNSVHVLPKSVDLAT